MKQIIFLFVLCVCAITKVHSQESFTGSVVYNCVDGSATFTLVPSPFFTYSASWSIDPDPADQLGTNLSYIMS